MTVASGELFLLDESYNPLIKLFTELKIQVYNPLESDGELSLGLDIWAKPGAKKEKIEIGTNGELIVFISERPVDGQANKGISKYVAKALGVSPSSFLLDGGAKSKFKRFKLIYTFTDHKNVDYYLEKLKKLFL